MRTLPLVMLRTARPLRTVSRLIPVAGAAGEVRYPDGVGRGISLILPPLSNVSVEAGTLTGAVTVKLPVLLKAPIRSVPAVILPSSAFDRSSSASVVVPSWMASVLVMGWMLTMPVPATMSSVRR